MEIDEKELAEINKRGKEVALRAEILEDVLKDDFVAISYVVLAAHKYAEASITDNEEKTLKILDAIIDLAIENRDLKNERIKRYN